MESITTKKKVRAIASHLEDMDDDNLDVFIEDAALEVNRIRVPQDYREKLERWLAAHLATLDKERPTSYSAGDHSLSYDRQAQMSIYSTPYGQEYMRILRSIRGDTTLRVM